jgi:hypothetical protein
MIFWLVPDLKHELQSVILMSEPLLVLLLAFPRDPAEKRLNQEATTIKKMAQVKPDDQNLYAI